MTCFEEAVAVARQSHCVVASTRVKVGAALEEQAISECEQLMEPGASVLCNAAVKGKVAQLYFDAYAAAVWTSAHVEYLANRNVGMEEPPAPNMLSVPCAFTSPDLSEIYARRMHPKSCSKLSAPLLQLIARCTNPGARGWNPVLEASLKVPGIRRIVTREFEICLTGLHPQLHPALRPNWKRRYAVMRVAAERCANEKTNGDILSLAVQTKEVMRRLLASTMSNCMAMHVALSELGHPVRHLHQPPMQLPNAGMEAAMAAFTQAGLALADNPPSSLFEVVNFRFARAQRRVDGLQWVMGWLGKGTPDCAPRTTLVELAGDMWATTFKTNFIAFWMHGMSKKLRISRLDAVQHEAIHSMNAVTTLCAALPVEDQLNIQRIVLCDPAAPTRTLSDVANILGIVGADTLSNNYKNASDALASIGALGAHNAALLFSYARVAWVRDQVLIVNFDKETAQRQVSALLRRLRHKLPDDCTDAVAYANAKLPTHATCLCVCAECQRVANAHVCNGVADKPAGVFNEIGVSQSMIRWSHLEERGEHMCCAKRSSAALKTAVAFQDYMRKRKIESEDTEHDGLATLMAPRTASSVESGIAARVRRDAKNGLEQRAVAAACGDSTMLTVPIIGRALRVYGSWYALCGYCAAVTRVTEAHWYGANVCCLRCDHQMVYRAEDGEGLVERVAKKVEKICRYCGAIDRERSGARWKQVKAPLDVAGVNANLPAPLRRCWYCPLHYRCWIPGAHRVMQTRVILAHLATNAKPVCFTDQADEEGDEGTEKKQPAPTKSKAKRRRLPKL